MEPTKSIWDRLDQFELAIGILVGLIVGLIVDLLSRCIWEWLHRPILRITSDSPRIVITRAFVSDMSGYRPMSGLIASAAHRDVHAFSFNVLNKGNSAASNVAGTLEFDRAEHRVCWYEGNVAYYTINPGDHTFLDVYGVILDADRKPTNEIVVPTEHGWEDSALPKTKLDKPLKVRLRITAANASRASCSFTVDPEKGCVPVSG